MIRIKNSYFYSNALDDLGGFESEVLDLHNFFSLLPIILIIIIIYL